MIPLRVYDKWLAAEINEALSALSGPKLTTSIGNGGPLQL